MIAWSIKAAFDSKCFDRVIVSTDDEEIANIARSHQADVPFIRPNQLANDTTGTKEVVIHAIEWLRRQGINCDAICCLYATAPFVQPKDLQQALKLMEDSKPGTLVFSATSFPFPIQRAIYLNSDGYSSMFDPKHMNSRSQDLKEAFHDAGQFYWASPECWLSVLNIFEGMRPLILPRWRVQDIDTEEDWMRAELIHQLLANQGLIHV